MTTDFVPERTVSPAPVANAAWRPALLMLAALLLVLVLVHRETLASMISVWRHSETYAHGFLVPPLSAWLIWRQRRQLVSLQPGVWEWALLPMMLASLAWGAGELLAVNSVRQFAFIAMLVLAVPLVLGPRIAQRILFPLGFLFFSVPVGEFLLPVLMEGTADFTVAALHFSGVPVYREGLQFVIPSGNWSVVEACSGVRYLIASLMVGTLFAYLNYQTRWRRWVFVGVSIVVPIIANWVRAYMIVMLGHLSNNQIAVGVDHLVYGWVFFGIVIMLMFWIGGHWSEQQTSSLPPADADEAAERGTTKWPMREVLAGLAALILASSPIIHDRWMRKQALRSPPKLELPAGFGAWRQSPSPVASHGWTPSFQNPRQLLVGGYSSDKGSVGIYLAYFRDQGSDSKLVSSLNRITDVDDSNWNRQSLTPMIAGGSTWETTMLRTGPSLGQRQGGVLVVVRRYWVDGIHTSSGVEAKLAMARARLAGRGDGGALLTLHAQAENEHQAVELIRTFAEESKEELSALLAMAREAP